MMMTYEIKDIHLLKKLIQKFKTKDDSKNPSYIKVEFFKHSIALWGMESSVATYFELSKPYIATKQNTDDFKNIKLDFDAKFLAPAIKSFSSGAKSCDEIQLIVLDKEIKLVGFKVNREFSCVVIKSIEDESTTECNATLLKNDCNCIFTQTLDVESNRLFEALISLHAKEDTKITVENSEEHPTQGYLCFKCSDDVEVAKQTQHLTLSTEMQRSLSTFSFEFNIHYRGMDALRKFTSTVHSVGKTNNNKNNSTNKKQETKKRKIEEHNNNEDDSVIIKLKLSKTADDPISLSFQNVGFLAKIFVASKIA